MKRRVRGPAPPVKQPNGGEEVSVASERREHQEFRDGEVLETRQVEVGAQAEEEPALRHHGAGVVVRIDGFEAGVGGAGVEDVGRVVCVGEVFGDALEVERVDGGEQGAHDVGLAVFGLDEALEESAFLQAGFRDGELMVGVADKDPDLIVTSIGLVVDDEREMARGHTISSARAYPYWTWTPSSPVQTQRLFASSLWCLAYPDLEHRVEN